jgi:hypothetical protein
VALTSVGIGEALKSKATYVRYFLSICFQDVPNGSRPFSGLGWRAL